MTLSLDSNNAKFQIRGYKPGVIQINNQTYTKSIIVASDKLIENWRPETISDLTTADLSPIVEMKPAILLIGTGTVLHFPDIEIYGDLINYGIGVEIMDTRAACRTYNALTAEDRHVVAALIIR